MKVRFDSPYIEKNIGMGFILIFFILLGILFTADNSVNPDQTSWVVTRTSQSPDETEETYLPTITPVKTQLNTANETLTADLITYPFLSSLIDDECVLPCYLGITPGETTWEEAQGIMENLGATYADIDVINNLSKIIIVRHTYTLNIYSKDNNTVSHIIALDERESMVLRISFSVLEYTRDTNYIEKYWGRYKLTEILDQFGEPDLVLIRANSNETSYAILLANEEPRIVVRFTGDKKVEGLMCPVISPIIWMVFYLTDSSSTEDIYPPGFHDTSHDAIWRSPMDVIGLDKHELYEWIIADPTVCFQIYNPKQ